jgi:glutamine amidotransferase
MESICILDYGSGNTRSVFNLLATVCDNVLISNNVIDIEKATHIVLPGVGSFGASMNKINSTLPMEVLKRVIFEEKKPFLGICVGMQVMADFGLEFEKYSGLSWIPGSITKLESMDLPLPHVGWNGLKIKKESKLLNGIDDGTDFYFVHSYAFEPVNKINIIATTEYGAEFCSVIESENLFGVQFHPEKSQIAGKKLMQNFICL